LDRGDLEGVLLIGGLFTVAGLALAGIVYGIVTVAKWAWSA